MDKDIKKFLEFIKVDKKLSKNTLESYQRDILQYKEYITENNINYVNVKNEDIINYLEYLHTINKKSSKEL